MNILLVFTEEQIKSVGFHTVDFGRGHSVLYGSLSEFSNLKVDESKYCLADKVFVMQDFHKTILEDLVGKKSNKIINLGLSSCLHGRELNWALKKRIRKYLD